MNKCKVFMCESTELVYSGTDAFMLGVPTEQVCYKCANAYNFVLGIIENANARAGA